MTLTYSKFEDEGPSATEVKLTDLGNKLQSLQTRVDEHIQKFNEQTIDNDKKLQKKEHEMNTSIETVENQLHRSHATLAYFIGLQYFAMFTGIIMYATKYAQ